MIKTEKLLFYNDDKIEVYKVQYDEEVVNDFITNVIKKYRKSYEFDFRKEKEIPKEYVPFDERVMHCLELCEDGYKIIAGIVHVYPMMAKILISDIKRKFGGYTIKIKSISSILKAVDDYVYSAEDEHLAKRTKTTVLNKYFSLYNLETVPVKRNNFSKNQIEKAKENTEHLEKIKKKGIKLLEKSK